MTKMKMSLTLNDSALLNLSQAADANNAEMTNESEQTSLCKRFYGKGGIIMKNKNMKGFTLVEMIVVIAIICILSLILIPTMIGFVKDAKCAAAVADARIIKTSVECSLVETLPHYDGDTSAAFNKIIYLDLEKSKKMSEREYETVGAFTNVSWCIYRTNGNSSGGSQAIDKIIAGALDESFSENWKTGKKTNPMKYNTKDKNCAKYLKENNTNFGLVVVYDTLGFVRMMQVYRKGVLVTYINGDYLVNSSPDAHFVGEGTWDTIYADCDGAAPEDYCRVYLANGQIGNNGHVGGWY